MNAFIFCTSSSVSLPVNSACCGERAAVPRSDLLLFPHFALRNGIPSEAEVVAASGAALKVRPRRAVACANVREVERGIRTSPCPMQCRHRHF